MARGDDSAKGGPAPPRRNPFRQEILSPKEAAAQQTPKRDENEPPSQPQEVGRSFSDRLDLFAGQSYPEPHETEGRVRENLQGLKDLEEILPPLAGQLTSERSIRNDIVYLRGFLFALWNESTPPEPSLAHLRLVPEDKAYALEAHGRILKLGVTASLMSDDIEDRDRLTEALTNIAGELERSAY